MYFTQVHFLKSFSTHKPNNKRSTNPFLAPYAPLSMYTFIKTSSKLQLLPFSLQHQRWIVYNMYKNIYDPKNKPGLLLLFSITTMFAEFQGENKRIQQNKRNENKRMVKLDFSFSKLLFWAYIKKNQHIHFWVHDHSS